MERSEYFSTVYPELKKTVQKIVNSNSVPSKEQVETILSDSLDRELSLEEIFALLQIGTVKHELFHHLQEFFLKNFRKKTNKLYNISPLYLSSYCMDACSYCNFSKVRTDVKRLRLTIEDTLEEIEKAILPLGGKVIEFTLATDPELPSQKLCEYVQETKKLLKKHGSRGKVLLCSNYFSKKEYENLNESGLWGIVQWDETLHEESYTKYHRFGTPKTNFLERMNTHDKAMDADLEVATGILFGLADYRFDILMQVAKIRHLQEKHGKKPFVFGTPRIKSIHGYPLKLPHSIDDLQYETALMVYKIAEPKIGRWLQTREKIELNLRNAIDGDYYTFKCGDVKPGGYRLNAKQNNVKSGQFAVNELEKDVFEQLISKKNLSIIFDW